jgi:sugar lactone lactonase YvrE
LVKFDGTNWTVYNTSNSGLPDNDVSSLAIDGSGNKWIGIFDYFGNDGGLAKFDDTRWTVYNTSNSGLPNNYVHSLAIDGSGNVWIGTSGGGLAKFDDTSWTVYNTSNSGLPVNTIECLAIDGSGNVWIGTGSGLAVYREGGVVSVEENPIRAIVPNDYLLSQNYPNPFNPTTTIKYALPQRSDLVITVYNVLGKEVMTLINDEQEAGVYEVEFNASTLASGIYFYQLRAGNYVETKKMILLK